MKATGGVRQTKGGTKPAAGGRSLAQVGREALAGKIPDGVVVLDLANRIVEINPAARRMAGGPGLLLVGQQIQAVFAGWPASFPPAGDQEARLEVTLDEQRGIVVELESFPLPGGGENCAGRLVLLRDISGRRQVESDLRRANDQLVAQLAEIHALHEKLSQQFIRDPLTGLFNRGYLDETLTRELARAERDGVPASVIMLDLDHFKYVNDLYGHAAGDLVLQALGKLLRQQSRVSDIVCRYGGEEFLALLPGMPLEVAIRRSEQWRTAVEAMCVTYEGKEVRVTVSIGVAVFERGSNRDELMKSADKALYAAKDKGRNCVAVWVM